MPRSIHNPPPADARQVAVNLPDQDLIVPDGAVLTDLKAAIKSRCRTLEEAPRLLTRRFYDTFDWLAFDAGGAVEERLEEGRRQLLWHDLRGGRPSLAQQLDVDPGFAADLTAGPVKDRLLCVAGVRRLLRLLEVRSRVEVLRLLNDDEKTVVRLEIQQNRFPDSARERQGHLSVRFRLRPVRGYHEEFRQTLRMLEEDVGLSAARTPLVLEAVAAAGRRPGDYSTKLRFRLDPEQRADATVKEILLHLLDTIEANLAGTRDNLDSEFLHDLRVAVRRTRSALTQIKDVFPPEVVAEYKEQFAWVGQVTGPVRDLDVYLLDFDDYRESLPESLRPHLEPLRDFLHARYDEAQRNLAADLESGRFRDLLRDWRAFLETPVPERSALKHAMRPTKAVADGRIWRMYRRVRREGRAIQPSSPSVDLHELRKSCKKLRYLMEFFASLYPPDELRRLVKLLKALLDNLGKFQDLAVQADHLWKIAGEMAGEGCAGTDTLLTMGVLVGDLLDRQRAAREAFAATFAAFDEKQSHARFKSLFATSRTAK
jgi:CHAD domain-containing protein